MLFTTIVRDYLRWHYGAAFHELFAVWLNFLWFIIHFFSIPPLTKSLFSPWRRITEQKRRGFNFEALASYVIINLLSRLVGAIIRGTVIVIGCVALFVVIVAGAMVYLLWFAAPIILVGLLAVGISLIVTELQV